MSTKIDDLHFLDTNIKGLMQDKLFELNQRMEQARSESKYRDLRPSEVRVLQVLRGRPMNTAEVGRRLGVSRQAAHKAVSALVVHGLVRLETMPGNGRDKRVVVTAAAQRLRRAVAGQLTKIEAEIASNIGHDELETLRELLRRDWFDGPRHEADP